MQPQISRRSLRPKKAAYDCFEGLDEVARGRRGRVVAGTRLSYSRYLVRPYGLVGSAWHLPAAAFCTLSLGAIFVGELATPEDVVETVALGPLLAANWALSGPLAGIVTVVALVLFAGAAIIEKRNRPTIILLGAVSVLVALLVRVYATGIARLLSNHRHIRPSVAIQATPRTLDGIDHVSHGIGSLTRRELEIARLAAQGYTAAEISSSLHISNRTVESHLANTYTKLRITSRPELIRMSWRLGVRSIPGD
ncbi:MAG: hypothetical protein E6I86_04930 [Chloroflexi bacterium]|nr:MAG: hypothetical protein E6I86_04930 [Chloroflexota bacterium]